jgi:predicted phosphodiesterase
MNWTQADVEKVKKIVQGSSTRMAGYQSAARVFNTTETAIRCLFQRAGTDGPASKELKRILFVPDQHFPYNDKRYWKLLLKVGRALRPHTLCTLGDFGDFYATSRHSKNPNRARDLRVEVNASNVGLDDLDALGAQEKIFIEGNHEENLERYLMEKAPELFNMVKVQDLFRLRERGWRYVPYRQHTRIGKIYVTHDTGRAGAQAHVQAAAKFRGNVVIGHTHRCAINYSTTVTGKGHVAAMFGWGGDVAMAEYMYGVNTTDWALGFGVGTVEASGVTHLQACPVVNYRVVVDGQLYEG